MLNSLLITSGTTTCLIMSSCSPHSELRIQGSGLKAGVGLQLRNKINWRPRLQSRDGAIDAGFRCLDEVPENILLQNTASCHLHWNLLLVSHLCLLVLYSHVLSICLVRDTRDAKRPVSPARRSKRNMSPQIFDLRYHQLSSNPDAFKHSFKAPKRDTGY